MGKILNVCMFESVFCAQKAKAALNGADIYAGCCTLKIEYARVMLGPSLLLLLAKHVCTILNIFHFCLYSQLDLMSLETTTIVGTTLSRIWADEVGFPMLSL